MTPGPPSIRTASAAAASTGSTMISAIAATDDVEPTLDQPRGAAEIGIADSHDRNGADVVGHSGQGVEVVHPRNDEQFGVSARLCTHRIDQRAFLEAAIGHQQVVRTGRQHRRVQIGKAT